MVGIFYRSDVSNIDVFLFFKVIIRVAFSLYGHVSIHRSGI